MHELMGIDTLTRGVNHLQCDAEYDARMCESILYVLSNYRL